MVRDRMVRVGHADLGIGAAAELAADHERHDARHVALVGEQLQVEHQPGVLARTSSGTPAGRSNAGSSRRSALRRSGCAARRRARSRDTRRASLRSPAPNARWQAARPRRSSESRMLPFCCVRAPPRGRIGAAAVAEQPHEDRARIVLHRQRRRSVRAHADGAGVDAAAAEVARRRRSRPIERELERRQLRVAGRALSRAIWSIDTPARSVAARRDVGEEAVLASAWLLYCARPAAAAARCRARSATSTRSRNGSSGFERRRELECRCPRRLGTTAPG